MGKVTTAETKRKKKKGRPSLSDLQLRTLKQHKETLITSNPNLASTLTHRSSGRNPNFNSPAPEFIEGDDDDDDEREKKKVKLVVRLPQSNQQPFHHSSSLNSVSCGSDSNTDGENHEVLIKERKINDVGDRSGDAVSDQGVKISKATNTLHGSLLESGPTTPLPDKKLLVFILDRLQKKDTHGAFSEPVDPNELPDYHDIIHHPMDFGTVRKKLDERLYPNLEELEADVFLISSNAMQYNAPDTIYFRQARSIQELAKRDFTNLRHEGDDGEPQPKVVRRGRPPSKNLKKSLSLSPVDRVGPELSSGATLASGVDDTIGSNSYNLRRGPALYKFRSTDAFVSSHHSRSSENYIESVFNWNDEFPESILKADMKYGNKQFLVDENRRHTYEEFHPLAFGHESSTLTNLAGDMKQIIAVGLHSEHGYARSLARFAANLGPVVWKIASGKIKSVLPTGLKFGPGWVGENEASPQPPLFSFEKQKSSNNMAFDGQPSISTTPSTSDISSRIEFASSLPRKEEMVEAVRRLNSQTETVLKSGAPGTGPGPSFQTQKRPVLHSNRNGFNGVFGYDMSSQMGTGMVRHNTSTGQSGLEEFSVASQLPFHPAPTNHINSKEPQFFEGFTTLHSDHLSTPDTGSNSHEVVISGKPSWRDDRRCSLPVPPDLNVGYPTHGSPSSSLHIGSPQQPDLALQL